VLRNLITVVLASLAIGTPAHAVVVADQAMRYVNNEVITMGDVITRNQLRMADYSRRGVPIPQNRTELITFSKASLEELTDESLLVQQAKLLNAEPDRESVIAEVLEAAKAAGSSLTLRDRTDQIRLVMRSRSVDRVLGFYESGMPSATPQDLQRIYQTRMAEFQRPPRIRLLRILLRPSPPEALAELRTGRQALMRSAQSAQDPAVQAITNARLEAFLAGGQAEQEAALLGLVDDLATVPSADLDRVSAEVVKRAVTLREQAAAVRSTLDVTRQLTSERMQIAARWGGDREQAFRAAAQRLDPAASSGGQVGWVEPGTYSRAFDDVVFNLVPGELSEVFPVGDAFCLALVAQREEAKIRPYAEVVGELEMRERYRRRTDVRAMMIGIFRAKALIRDITTFDLLGR
jgi:hypothetical protein